MGFSVTLVQRENKKSKKGPIYLRLYNNGRSKYINTDVYVKPKYWSKQKRRVTSGHNDHLLFNEELVRLKNLAEKKAFQLKREGKFSLERLKSNIGSGGHKSVIEYAENYIKSLEDNHYWEHRKFKVVKKDLEHFLGKHPPAIEAVDLSTIEAFRKYLLSDKKRGKKNGPNTVRRKMTRLKGMFKQARQDGVITQNPFQDYKRIDKEESSRETLSLKQIKAIKELDLKEGSEFWHVRNYFMFSYYNAGIRFGDLCCLTWNKIVDGRLIYRMMKTGGRKDIKQLEPMQEILSHYREDGQEPDDLIFPILDKPYDDPRVLRQKISSKNVIVNRALGKLAGKAGIQVNVSFHVSRHSFSHHAMKKNLDLYQVSRALGHSDLSTTEEYLKGFDEKHLDEGMEKFFK